MDLPLFAAAEGAAAPLVPAAAAPVGVAVFVVPDKNLFFSEPYDRLFVFDDATPIPPPLLPGFQPLGARH